MGKVLRIISGIPVFSSSGNAVSFKKMIIIKGVDSDEDRDNIRGYLQNKYEL
jgi:hypothetical protein